jgi:hypothetical protein
MGDYWGNQPVVATNQHEVKMGDQSQAERTEESAPRAAPTLRKPGEELPQDSDKNNPVGTMQPVKMPPSLQRPGDPGYHPTVSADPKQGSGQSAGQGSCPATTPATGSQGTGSQGSSQQGQGSGGQPSGSAGSPSNSGSCPQTQSGSGSQQKNSDSSQKQQPSNSSSDQSNPLDKPQ